ncbi:hypothetical protein ACFQH2_18490 [Natronoarchaeum sp. GCM10025703]|uniref:hypothetical protein n=1 Tax=unclassified Natronoarchaeum TaxID=2620183 RepID=UPI00361558AB
MSEEQPTPPADLPDDVVDTLDEASTERLREIAEYAEELAEYHSREPSSGEDDRVQDPSEDRPDEVPSRATVTIKEINDNRYYYWQWRDGETIRSQYKGPVDSD